MNKLSLHIDILNYQWHFLSAYLLYSANCTHTDMQQVAVASGKQLSSVTIKTLYNLESFQEHHWVFNEFK